MEFFSQEITFLSRSGRNRKIETHVISQHNLQLACDVKELRAFCINIELPSIPPSDIDNKTIQVRYLIQVSESKCFLCEYLKKKIINFSFGRLAALLLVAIKIPF